MSIKIDSNGRGGAKRYIVALAAVVVLSGAVAFGPSLTQAATLTQAQIDAIVSLLQSFGADSSTISNVQSALTGTGGGGTTGGGTGAKCTFTKALTVGSRGDDVKCLQMYLNGAGHTVAASGAGSAGNETMYFGPATRAAVAKWQAANDVSPAAGYFGTISRAKYDAMVAGGGGTGGGTGDGGGTPPPTPVGSGLTVSAAAEQPAETLAPENAARVPFTKVVFTASADGDVTVNTVTVERQALADDTAIDGVVLLDENGTQVGVSKTLSSIHQAILNEPFTVKAGSSRTMTIGANMAADLDQEAGQVAKFALVAVDAGSSKVNGTFPIVGKGMTVNGTLAIGSVTMARGGADPGASATKEVGTAKYLFSSVKVTAGSAEDVLLKYVRWNQTGSAAKSDLKNVQVFADSTAYEAVVTNDGKYYVATFPSGGLKISKGNSIDIAIKGDIDGGSNRTVDFDLAKRTDVGVMGALYGYGIIPPQTGSSDPTDDTAAFSSTEDPWYDAAQVTISAGTIRVSASAAVPAQNVAVNLSNQPLGAFTIDVKGEPVSVGAMYFNATLGSDSNDTSSNGDINDITNITLVDADGKIVAGPVDGAAADSSSTSSSGDGSITFSTTVIFPVGVNTYKLLGKIGTDLDSNMTFAASTTPTDWGTVRGTVTGNTITPSPSSAITANTMTIKAGALTLTVSSIPIAQNAVAGSKQFLFASYILDATASGEDVRMVSIPLEYNVSSAGSATSLSNCKLNDGETAVTTGSNIVSPSAVASGSSFTFDGTGFTVPKGSSKTLGLKCDISVGAAGFYEWGLDSGQQTGYTGASGITSGQTVTETFNDSEGQRMTATSGGSLTVALDANTPGYQVANSGQTNVELVRIKYSASNEDIDIRQVGLQLSTFASNTPINLLARKATLWDATANKQIGEAVFATEDYATSSLIAVGDFRVPKDGSRVLIVKGDIAGISVSGPMVNSGDILYVDYDGANVGVNGNYGTGVASGNTVNGGSTDTASSGVRIFRSYPKFAYVGLSSAERSLSPGTTADKTLYKFSVTATGGDVAMYKFTFLVSSSTAPGTAGIVGATTSLFSLYAHTANDYGSPDTTFSSSGLLNSGSCFNGKSATGAGPINGAGNPLEIYMEKTQSTCNSATTTYVIPSGVTRYFRLAATVANVEGVTGQESFTAQFEGDAAFPTAHISGIGARTGDMGNRGQPSAAQAGTTAAANTVITTTGVDQDTNDDLIWSPISTTTAVTLADFDYTNGYLMPGLPTTNMTVETFTSPN